MWNSLSLYCLYLVLVSFVNIFTSDMQVLKKEQPQSEPRSFWDVLRHGARIVLFSDLMEVQVSSSSRFLIRISYYPWPFPVPHPM